MKKILAIALSIGSLLLLGCAEKSKSDPPPPLNVTYFTAVQKDVPIMADFVGQTYGLFDISIRARIEGVLTGIHFREGFQVKKGKLLYTIDPDPFLQNVAQYQSGVAEAQTALAKTKSDLDRVEPLAKINAVSRAELDAKRAQYEAAQANLEAAKAALRASNIELGYTKLYAPISGIIGKTEAKVGDFVGREPNPVVLNAISRIDTILVRFSITESQYLEVIRYRRAQKVLQSTNEELKEEEPTLKLILSDGSVHDYMGRVDFIDRDIDPTTGSLLVQASFPNPSGILRPGLFARVRAPINDMDNAILVPQRSLQEIQGNYQVYTISNENTIELKPVKVGPKVGNMWIITEGLQANEKVVVDGLHLVKTGMPVAGNESEFEMIES